MALWCRLFMRVLILNFGIFRLFSFSMECSCMAPLTPVVMVMRGLIFHPLFCIALISGSNLVCFCVMACFFVMAICEFYELNRGRGRRCHRCLCMIRGSDYA
jgi:hypothetical protein